MSVRCPGLIAVDGVNGPATLAAAREALGEVSRGQRGGVSTWDASGLFQDLAVAGEEAGPPSARTLLLLYAADLAFRLRWEIRPKLAENRIVVAAPYLDTAIAFGRAAGLRSTWLTALFRFALRPDESRSVDQAPARSSASGAGLVEFVSGHIALAQASGTRDELVERTRDALRTVARRRGRRARRG